MSFSWLRKRGKNDGDTNNDHQSSHSESSSNETTRSHENPGVITYTIGASKNGGDVGITTEKSNEVDQTIASVNDSNDYEKLNNIQHDITEIIEIDDENHRDFIKGDATYMTNSPYPEVRAAVSTDIDPDINLFHWRAFFLVTLFVIVFAGVNQFFALRYPSLTVSYIVGLIIAYPIGKVFEKFPDIRFKRAPFFNLNPGKFSIQEHALIVIILSLTSSTSYAMDILLAQSNFYKQEVPIGYSLLVVFSSQLLGMGAAYITQRWIVEDHNMLWPQNLVTATVFTTMAKSNLAENIHPAKIKWSRYKMFVIVLIGSFIWYWIPGFLFTATSYFNFICWIVPNNKVVNQVFGTSSGLGIIPITFDWTMITQALGTSPLATPFVVAANTYSSVFLFFLIILPCLYYTNVWDAKYMPMISSSTYDRYQSSYNVTKIIGSNMRIDKEKYKQYSPMFIPYSYLLSYALNFVAVTSMFTHTALYSGKDIIARLKNKKHGGQDIHTRLYKKHFKPVPLWWAGVIFLISLGLTFGAVSGYNETSQTPFWNVFLSLGVAALTFIPQGILEGCTNTHVGLNILLELIAGYCNKFNPFANMLVKLYLFISVRQGLDISRDLSLSKYMKVPPRTVFFYQIYGTVLSGLVNVGVQQWMRFNVKDICVPGTEFSCPGARVIFNASIIFSLVDELFSAGKKYNAILYFFLIGAVLPFFTFFLYKKHPQRWFGKINIVLNGTGASNIPPSTIDNYSLYFLTCFIFNYWIKKYYPLGHAKFNNVISAGFDCGVAIAGVLIFLCVTYPGGTLTWWGNTVHKNTMDFDSVPFYTLQEGETFGPKSW